jgi:hypothetical protein
LSVTEYGNAIPFTFKAQTLADVSVPDIVKTVLRNDLAKVLDSAAAAASTNMGRENVRNEINNEIEEEHAADICDGRYHTHTHTLTHSLKESRTSVCRKILQEVKFHAIRRQREK